MNRSPPRRENGNNDHTANPAPYSMHLDSVQLRDPLATNVVVSLHELSDYMKLKAPTFSMSEYVSELYKNTRQRAEQDKEVSMPCTELPQWPRVMLDGTNAC